MPIYHLKCNLCGKIFDKYAKIEDINRIKCECGGIGNWLPTTCNYLGIMFGKENKPLVLEHMTEDDDDIVSVTTKSQLKEACKKHSCISPILD